MIDEWKDRAAHRPLEDRVGSVTLSSQALNEALHPRPETDWPLEEEAEQAEAPVYMTVEDCMRIIRAHAPDDLKGMEAAFRANTFATQPAASPEQAEATNDREAYWFALVQGAASEIENAANCLQDPDAKRVAISGAEHYRAKAKELSRRGESGVAHG